MHQWFFFFLEELHRKQNTGTREVGGVGGKVVAEGCLSFMYKDDVVYFLNPKISSMAAGVCWEQSCREFTVEPGLLMEFKCNAIVAQPSSPSCLPKDERYYAWGGEAEPSPLHFCRIVLNVTVSWSGERFSSQYAKICFKGWFISLYTVLKTTYIIHLITYIDCMTTGIICRAQYNENGRYSLI